MLSDEMKNWLAQFEQDQYTDSNGFFRLPYKGNSPELLISSFDKLPFVKFDKIKQTIYTSIPFFEGGFHYQALEKGCWVIYTNLKYKANVCFDLLRDPTVEHNYYMLSLNVITPKAFVYEEFSDRKITFPKYSWTFAKPTEDSHIKHMDLNFAGAENRFVTLYFNEEWFQNNLADNSLFCESKLNDFFQSEKRFLY
ncbi:MAG TPA: hypothetical protein VGB95_07020, partial [Chitinophagales bacterium]